MVRRITLTFVLATCLLALAACGAPAPPPDLKGTLGYWAVSGDAALYARAPGGFLLHVEQRGDSYYLGIDGLPPQRASLDEGRIVLPWTGSGGRPSEFGMDAGRPAIFAWVSHGKDASPQPTGYFWAAAPATIKQLTATAYRQQANAEADADTHWGMYALAMMINDWAGHHDGSPPPLAAVRHGGALDRWFQGQNWGLSAWPYNPFSGQPMSAGKRPGCYTYRVDGSSWSLSGHLSDGSAFDAKAEADL